MPAARAYCASAASALTSACPPAATTRGQEASPPKVRCHWCWQSLCGQPTPNPYPFGAESRGLVGEGLLQRIASDGAACVRRAGLCDGGGGSEHGRLDAGCCVPKSCASQKWIRAVTPELDWLVPARWWAGWAGTGLCDGVGALARLATAHQPLGRVGVREFGWVGQIQISSAFLLSGSGTSPHRHILVEMAARLIHAARRVVPSLARNAR